MDNPQHYKKQIWDCPTCSRSYPSKANFKKHTRSQKHQNKCKDLGIYCLPCNKAFISLNGLESHNRVLHMKKGVSDKESCTKVVREKLSRNEVEKVETGKLRKEVMELVEDANRDINDIINDIIAAGGIAADPPQRKHVIRRWERYEPEDNDKSGGVAIEKTTTLERRKPAKKTVKCTDGCERSFINEAALQQHLKYHKRHKTGGSMKKIPVTNNLPTITKPEITYTCKICSTTHPSKKTLSRHYHDCDLAHRLPFLCAGITKSCNRRFKKLSGMIDHIESGACRSGMNRESMDEFIRWHHTEYVITLKVCDGVVGFKETNELLIGKRVESDDVEDEDDVVEDEDDGDDDYEFIPTPTFSDSEWEEIPTPPRSSSPHSQTSPAEPIPPPPPPSDEKGLCCPLCTRSFFKNTEFKHQENMSSPPLSTIIKYYCALRYISLDEHADKRTFRTLSGLVQHMESSVCKKGILDESLKYVVNMAEEGD